MERADYAGGAGYAPAQDPDTIPSGSERANALAARRDLTFRLPAGRALDHADLVDMLHEGNQTWRAIQMRARLLDYVRRQLPGGVLVSPLELRQAQDAAAEEPERWRDRVKMAEWPQAR